MHINYNSYILRKITGAHEETFPIEKEISIEKLIGILSVKYGPEFKASMLDEESKKLRMLVLVNGESIIGIEHILIDKDIVNILSFVTGG